MLVSLQDGDLPVRFSAATSIHKMLHQKKVVQHLLPHLEVILSNYLDLMAKIDHDELLGALEELVDHFAGHIEPYALKLTVELVKYFFRLVKSEDEEDGEAALTAVGSLGAIKQIIKSVHKNKELLALLEVETVSIVHYTLSSEGMDTVEEGVEILTLLLYHQDGISQRLWECLPPMVHSLAGTPGNPYSGYCFEFLHNMLAALQNYVLKGKEVIIASEAGSGYSFASFWKVIQAAVDANAQGKAQDDLVYAVRLVIALVENLYPAIFE